MLRRKRIGSIEEKYFLRKLLRYDLILVSIFLLWILIVAAIIGGGLSNLYPKSLHLNRYKMVLKKAFVRIFFQKYSNKYMHQLAHLKLRRRRLRLKLPTIRHLRF